MTSSHKSFIYEQAKNLTSMPSEILIGQVIMTTTPPQMNILYTGIGEVIIKIILREFILTYEIFKIIMY